jgi:hypothetical protein
VKSWQIVHVDLLKPILSLPMEEDKEGAYVYFCCQGAVARPQDFWFFRAAAFLSRLVR